MSHKHLASAALLLLICTTAIITAAAANPEAFHSGPSNSLLRRLLGSNFLGHGLSLGGGGSSGAYASTSRGRAYAGTGYPGGYPGGFNDPYFNDPYYNRPYYGSRRGYNNRRRNQGFGRRLATA